MRHAGRGEGQQPGEHESASHHKLSAQEQETGRAHEGAGVLTKLALLIVKGNFFAFHTTGSPSTPTSAAPPSAA